MIAFAPLFNYLPVELVPACNDTTTYKGLLPANNPSEKLFEGLLAGISPEGLVRALCVPTLRENGK